MMSAARSVRLSSIQNAPRTGFDPSLSEPPVCLYNDGAMNNGARSRRPDPPQADHIPRATPLSRSFAVLATLTTAATYLLIVLGGTVRATGSGLACPDWPTCHGSIIPSTNQHVLIEYSHRLTASAVSILVVLLAIAAIWIWSQPRYLKVLSLIAAALLVVQVILGGVTVLAELPPQIVTAHLATATLLLGVLTLISVYSLSGGRRERSGPATKLSRLAMVPATGVFLLILAGSYVVGSDASLACHTWPLCNGQIIPTGGQAAVDVNFLHRVVALLTAIAVIVIAIRAWQAHRNQPTIISVATLMLLLFVAQIFIGAGNIWLNLAAGVQVAHLAAAEALWLLATALTAWPLTIQGAPAQAATLSLDTPISPPATASNRRPRFGDRKQPPGGTRRQG